jgi:hypothetical protein
MKSQKATALAAMCLLAATSASAQDKPGGKPSGTVRIQQIQVAFIGSGALGGGTLNFRGKSYPITVGGLGVGGVGASRLTASGNVYGLSRREDFAGAYVAVRSGWALADHGKGTMWLRNGNGVTMKLNAKRQGLQTALGADGVVISFK